MVGWSLNAPPPRVRARRAAGGLPAAGGVGSGGDCFLAASAGPGLLTSERSDLASSSANISRRISSGTDRSAPRPLSRQLGTLEKKLSPSGRRPRGCGFMWACDALQGVLSAGLARGRWLAWAIEHYRCETGHLPVVSALDSSTE